MKTIIIRVICTLVFCPTFCFGAVTLPWSTTFDCAEWGIQDGALTCDGMSAGLACENYSDLFGCPEDGCGVSCELLEEQITASSNNPIGGGGLGLRHPLCGCSTANSATSSGGGVVVTFAPTKQLWIRSYMKWGANPTWSSGHGADIKLFYLYDNTGSAQTILKWHNGVLSASTQGIESANNLLTHEWIDVHGNGGNTGDDEWHYIELYISADTSYDNGVFSAWIDGLPVQTLGNVRYGFTEAGSTGWQEMRFLSNAHYVYGPTTVYLDDLVVYNTTPPNLDSEGNPYIGPIETAASPVVEILIASGQTTTASVFTIPGTATADTGQTISGVACSGQTVTPDDGAWDEQEEAFTCLANLALGENTLVFIGSDGTRTGHDSITAIRIKKTSKINGSATIKNATIHQ